MFLVICLSKLFYEVELIVFQFSLSVDLIFIEYYHNSTNVPLIKILCRRISLYHEKSSDFPDFSFFKILLVTVKFFLDFIISINIKPVKNEFISIFLL